METASKAQRNMSLLNVNEQGVPVIADGQTYQMTKEMKALDEGAWMKFYEHYQHRMLCYHMKLCHGDIQQA